MSLGDALFVYLLAGGLPTAIYHGLHGASFRAAATAGVLWPIDWILGLGRGAKELWHD